VKSVAGRSKPVIVAAVVAVLVIGGGTLTYVLSRSSSPVSGSAIEAGTTTTTQGLTLLVQPPDGSTSVAPDTIVSVTATTGRISAVTVAAADGRTVVGALSPTGTAWRSSATLALKTDYTVTIDATTPNGRPTQQVSHFQSLVPAATLGLAITPGTGLTVGVAQPIVLRFDHPVVNKDALIANLQVTQSKPVAGGWHWFSTKELHFRPQVYWPTGEQVTIKANLDGFNAGNGVWGAGSTSSSFTVGDAHISTANVVTDQMTVTSNGVVVATYPISAGRTVYPTMNGIHIDLYRQQDVHMVSSSVGIPVNSPDGYDEHVYWDVNISDGGEFVHAAPWSTGAQGNSNVSHGCINLSPENATAFYNFSHIGDVIEVTGSPRGPDLTDHGTMDWNLAWSSWTPATA
jgi:lipoprotein-anchoring transpeptidase ErfK/SrfK